MDNENLDKNSQLIEQYNEVCSFLAFLEKERKSSEAQLDE